MNSELLVILAAGLVGLIILAGLFYLMVKLMKSANKGNPWWLSMVFLFPIIAIIVKNQSIILDFSIGILLVIRAFIKSVIWYIVGAIVFYGIIELISSRVAEKLKEK